MADQHHSSHTSADSQAATQPEPPPRKRGGGPRSEQGKNKSRANACKDSLTSSVVFTPEMAAAIAEMNRILTEEYKPRTPFERMIILDMAVAKARLDLARDHSVRDYQRCILRALHFWDHDEEARALEIYKYMDRYPARTVHALGETKKGAELLISYWKGLR